jgi:hypothetical protein
MSKTRDLGDFTSAGNPLADGTIDVADINGVTATVDEINILDGLTATTSELNNVTGVNSDVQTQLDGKVDLAGDTMTGALVLSADPTVALGAATKQYVDTQVAGVVDSAPATLDTLNELAAALGDDANFATTVTNSLALKANSADLGTAASLDVGTSANNVVQLDGSAKLPAVDGSALTGIEGVPSGIIALWSGSTASIPSGWVICDGNNSTPDLRDRFIVGAGSTYAVDATGGSNTVTLAESEMPGHTHTISGNTSTTGAHTHTLSGNTGNSGNHTHTGSTSNTGNHSHNVPVGSSAAGGFNTPPAPGVSASGNQGTSNTGAHSHNLTINGGGDHSHTLSGNAASAGDHSHTLSATAASTGGGGAHENRPPYYALAYIMKT